MSVSDAAPEQPSSWSERYGERHKLIRIDAFPPGIVAPQKVRVYARGAHYVLQAWDPATKRTVSDRVDGDLLAALIRARELDERIINFRRSGRGSARLTHNLLVQQFITDLGQRAEAGEIDLKTVQRYGDALQHYLVYVARCDHGNGAADVRRVDRSFQLRLAAYLRTATVTANGRPQGIRRPLSRGDYVLDVVRAMYSWAADPQRGGLLGDGFVNPFVRLAGSRRPPRTDPTDEPAITLSMAAEFLGACDRWQLPLFAGMACWGLRPSELSWLWREEASPDWLLVRCHPDLEYYTKGRRDKRIPLLPSVAAIWHSDGQADEGLLFRSRAAADLPVLSLSDFVDEYRRRSAKIGSVAERRRVRDRLLRENGGVFYDLVEAEFHRVVRRLKWPRSATLKGFRHLFATSLENGGIPEFYRRYLMGQSPGRSAIVTYTHLNQLQQQYQRVVMSELGQVVHAVSRRWAAVSTGEDRNSRHDER